MSLAHCDFCNEFTGGTANAFHARYKDRTTRTILATEDIRAFPSIGQLVEGYSLIAPLKHYRALDEIPGDLLAEFEGVYRDVKAAVSNVYGPLLCYEHGARGPSAGGCGIYHAHLHVVPFGGHPDPASLLKARFPYKRLVRFGEISPETKRLSSYLFYEDMESNRYLFLTGELPSQYMRKLLAEILGKSEWDWRSAEREERLLSTLDRLSSYLETIGSRSAVQSIHNAGDS